MEKQFIYIVQQNSVEGISILGIFKNIESAKNRFLKVLDSEICQLNGIIEHHSTRYDDLTVDEYPLLESLKSEYDDIELLDKFIEWYDNPLKEMEFDGCLDYPSIEKYELE